MIFGGTGFLGKVLVDFLLDDNANILLFVRNFHNRKDLQKYKSNSQIKIINWNLSDTNIIQENMKHVDVVINLCGILYENKRGDFDKVHSDLPSILGELCKQNKVNNFIR